MKKTKAIRLINSANPTSRNQKYSNKTLFNRREKERELISNLKDQKTTTSNFYNYKKSLPEVINNVNKLKINKKFFKLFKCRYSKYKEKNQKKQTQFVYHQETIVIY